MTSIIQKTAAFIAALWSDSNVAIESATVARDGNETVIRLRDAQPARAAKPKPKPQAKPSAAPAKRGRAAKGASVPPAPPAAPATGNGHAGFDTLAYVRANPGSSREDIEGAARRSGMRSPGPALSALKRMVKAGTIELDGAAYFVAEQQRTLAA